MMRNEIKPKFVLELDPDFCPIILMKKAFDSAVSRSDNPQKVKIALERNNGFISSYTTKIFNNESLRKKVNCDHIERLVKSLLWVKGGWKLMFAGPSYIGDFLCQTYCIGGKREFDVKFMEKIYDHPFLIKFTSFDEIPTVYEEPIRIGRNLDGCRIGFDAGGSDRKVSAVLNGKVVYSEEVVWHPKLKSDPAYHYNEILQSFKAAAAKLPKIDAIGVSAAGIYINNKVKVASLFLKVPENEFKRSVTNIFLDLNKEMGDVPMEIVNDGDVTALAGAMNLNENSVLGIAMGTSEAAGYVDSDGFITGWLNELAFVPLDLNPNAMVDEWSGDIGCGVKYLSQDGVIKLSSNAGILFDPSSSPAEKLTYVQQLLTVHDERVKKVFQSIGCYLGYAIAYYGHFYDFRHVLILGRVTSGLGGKILFSKAKEVLKSEFPDFAAQITIHLPDEESRRVGQSIAAASLPKIKKV